MGDISISDFLMERGIRISDFLIKNITKTNKLIYNISMENTILISDVLMEEDLEKLVKESNGEDVCWCEDSDDLCGYCADKRCEYCEEPLSDCECCVCRRGPEWCERCMREYLEAEYRHNCGFSAWNWE